MTSSRTPRCDIFCPSFREERSSCTRRKAQKNGHKVERSERSRRKERTISCNKQLGLKFESLKNTSYTGILIPAYIPGAPDIKKANTFLLFTHRELVPTFSFRALAI